MNLLQKLSQSGSAQTLQQAFLRLKQVQPPGNIFQKLLLNRIFQLSKQEKLDYIIKVGQVKPNLLSSLFHSSIIKHLKQKELLVGLPHGLQLRYFQAFKHSLESKCFLELFGYQNLSIEENLKEIVDLSWLTLSHSVALSQFQIKGLVKSSNLNFSLPPKTARRHRQLLWYLEKPFSFTQMRDPNQKRSNLEMQVEAIMRANQIKYKRQQIIGCFQVDFCIDNVVLEVQGGSHYHFPKEEVSSAQSRVRKQVLKKLGFRMQEISFIRWNKLKSTIQRKQFIMNLL